MDAVLITGPHNSPCSACPAHGTILSPAAGFGQCPSTTGTVPDGILPGVTAPSEHPTGELLLVAVVEMAPGHAAAGQAYEDAVLGLLERHGGSVERRMRGTDPSSEVHVIRFRSRAGYETFMVDPDRIGHRAMPRRPHA
jgi:hypothetical protein